MKCPHTSFRWVRDEDLGDRILKSYVCRGCNHPRTRNVKKPRYTTRKPPVAQSPKKQSKTRQRGPVRKRKAIKPVSDKRKGWNALYKAKQASDGSSVMAWGINGYTALIPTILTERHHPLGRVGCRITFYRHVTHDFHRWLHDNAAQARELGFILPEMSGRESGADQPDPFGILPGYRAYLAEHGLH